jgi:hypothetical protein
MKKYIKDGKIKRRNQIIVHKNGKQIINPTEEMLLEDGWKIHEPVPYEPTEEEILNREKEHRVEDILRYDSSQEINCFYIGGQEIWLDKATRAGLKLRFEAEIAMGKTDTILWHEGQQFPLQLELAMQMLYAIEIYASACYDNTQKHIANVNNLNTLEELKAYDYRIDYPEKLRF